MNQYDHILEMFCATGRDIKILPTDSDRAEGIKEKYQIPNGGLLGGVVYNTGGIIVEGRVRLYGAGGPLDINIKNEKWGEEDRFLIGEDIFGGLFAMIVGGNVCYFAPDSLEWENFDVDYSGFISWLAKGDVNLFYQDFLFDGWEKEAESLSVKDGFSFVPFLWSGQKDGKESDRRAVPMDEIMGLNMEFVKSLRYEN